MHERLFWDKVKKTSSCWFWLGAKTDGYGVLNHGRVGYKAHRVAYELLVGKIPEGMQIDHLCGNRACVNPEHLETVSQSTNLARRHSVPKRSINYKSKKSYLLYIHDERFRDEPKKSALVNELLATHYEQFRGLPNPRKDGLPPTVTLPIKAPQSVGEVVQNTITEGEKMLNDMHDAIN